MWLLSVPLLCACRVRRGGDAEAACGPSHSGLQLPGSPPHIPAPAGHRLPPAPPVCRCRHASHLGKLSICVCAMAGGGGG